MFFSCYNRAYVLDQAKTSIESDWRENNFEQTRHSERHKGRVHFSIILVLTIDIILLQPLHCSVVQSQVCNDKVFLFQLRIMYFHFFLLNPCPRHRVNIVKQNLLDSLKTECMLDKQVG